MSEQAQKVVNKNIPEWAQGQRQRHSALHLRAARRPEDSRGRKPRLASVARETSFREPLPRAQLKKGKAKGRSRMGKPRPHDYRRCAEHGGSCNARGNGNVPAPP